MTRSSLQDIVWTAYLDRFPDLTDAGENGKFWPVYFALGAEENVMSVEMRRSK